MPEPSHLDVALRLARDLECEGDQISLLVTCPVETASGQHTTLPATCLLTEAPADHAASVRNFLEHWQPDALVWLGGTLRPRTLNATAKAKLPMILAVANSKTLKPTSVLWPRRLPRAELEQFTHILCADTATARRLRQAGLTGPVVEAPGLIDAGHVILSCIESDRAELADVLSSRPRWLAADPAPQEFGALAAAHRIASHRSHRLTMLLATDDTATAKTYFTGAGFAVADRAAGDEPAEATEILVSDTAELGAFYRLAPIAFLGGSLATGARRDPFEAANLGSALLHGPRTAPFAAQADRLDTAGAARAVHSGEDLGATLERLLSPDRAAQLAHAAWDVASEGAAAANRLLSLMRSATDNAPGARD